jgi:thiazole synthase ThiGH ThiG subunit
MDTKLTLGGKTFRSRLLVGTGKYPDNQTMVRALEASGADIATRPPAIRWTRPSAPVFSPGKPGCRTW